MRKQLNGAVTMGYLLNRGNSKRKERKMFTKLHNIYLKYYNIHIYGNIHLYPFYWTLRNNKHQIDIGPICILKS